MLHCLESRENITAVLREAFRILHNPGVLFGRTLSNTVDKEKLIAINPPKSEDERFILTTTKALQEGVLLGLGEQELRQIAQSVGFAKIYTEIKPTKAWKPIRDFYFRCEKHGHL